MAHRLMAEISQFSATGADWSRLEQWKQVVLTAHPITTAKRRKSAIPCLLQLLPRTGAELEQTGAARGLVLQWYIPP